MQGKVEQGKVLFLEVKLGIFRMVLHKAFGPGDQEVKEVFEAVMIRLKKKEDREDPNWKRNVALTLLTVLEELHEKDVASNELLASLCRKINEW